MISTRVRKPENSCPVCKSDLVDPGRLQQAENVLDLELSRRVRDATRHQTEEYRRMLKEIRDRHQAELRELRKSNAASQSELKGRLTLATQKERAAHKTELAKLKKDQQEQLRNLRDAYDRENLRLQKEQEGSFNVQLQEIIRNYGTLATGHQKEQERLKKVQDENDAIVRKRDSEIAKLKIELAKSSSKLEIKELVLKLRERDDTIQRLNTRIEELEGRFVVPSPPAPKKESPKVLTDDEQKEKLKEYMRAIIEITRSQQAEKKKMDIPPEKEMARNEIPESKLDKKFGWFF